MKRFFLSALLIFSAYSLTAQTGQEAAKLVQKQLDAYNSRDVEAFLKVYSDTVKIYNHPQQLSMDGIEQMRTTFTQMFARTPDLHCTIMNRMVLGNVVLDHESVIFNKNQPATQVVAMYKIAGGKIVEVYFISPDEL